MATRLTAKGFLLRFLVAFLLVFLTYNPFGYSVFHWIMDADSSLPVRALVAIALITGWVVFIRATLRSLGGLGITLVAVLLACLLWVLVDFGWLNVDNADGLISITLLMLSLLLAIGMSWSHIRRRMSGQLDVDDIDE